MYGLVNKGLEELICSQYGEDTWERIKEKAGLDIDLFISNEPYPDEVTYSLVGAASEILGASAETLLAAFGEHWLLYTAKEGYGHLFDAAGAKFKDFLLALPNFHGRIRLIYPDLKPPEFRFMDVTENSLILHYFSSREGLAPMVIGLIKGAGKLYKTRVEIEHIRRHGESADCDEFLVRFEPARADQ